MGAKTKEQIQNELKEKIKLENTPIWVKPIEDCVFNGIEYRIIPKGFYSLKIVGTSERRL